MYVCMSTGFAWPGFGSGGATGGASVRSCQKLPLCPTEPTPAGSKMDLLLAKAKPISYCGGTSGITQLKRGEKILHSNLQQEKGVRRCETNNCADTQVSEGGAGGAPGTGAEIFPLQPVEQALVRQAVPCSPGRSTVEQIPTCSPGRTPRWSRGMPKGGCEPMGSPSWSSL